MSEKEFSKQGYRCPNHGANYPWVAYNFVTRESFCGECGAKLEKKEAEQ